ncbi:MAG: PDGLE domain-containing protein [Candidatus Bathyarchaeia archaeon]
MKAYFVALILILVSLSILLPFASDFPDGLERVAEDLGVEEHEPFWKGLMPDYTIPTIENPYLSTFTAGVVGIIFVVCFTFIFAVAATKPNGEPNNKYRRAEH